MRPSLSQSEYGSETDRMKIWSAGSGVIWPIRVASRLETCSLPSTPAMKLKLPKVNSMSGVKVIALMLIGAIKPAEMISTTPLLSAPTVDVCYWQYYLYGGSSDRKSDGSTRRRVLDRFEPSRGGNTLRPICGCIILMLGCALGSLEAFGVLRYGCSMI